MSYQPNKKKKTYPKKPTKWHIVLKYLGVIPELSINRMKKNIYENDDYDDVNRNNFN